MQQPRTIQRPSRAARAKGGGPWGARWAALLAVVITPTAWSNQPSWGQVAPSAKPQSAAVAASLATAAAATALVQVLDTRTCVGCSLADADLVLADLRQADLRRAQLQRANLSQAQLDGAKLQGANLQFTSLLGASLRGADLRGALLEGTDLRQADLSGALLDRNALARAHWEQAKGLALAQLSYAQLHNAGVQAHQAGDAPEAERWFSEAIRRQREAAVSWVARGISRSQQGKDQQAADDFRQAAALYEQQGETARASQLRDAAASLTKAPAKGPGGNGMGSQLLGAAAGVIQLLGPLAMLALTPLGL